MIYRTLPGTNLDISVLGFGNFPFGADWWGRYKDDEAVAIQDRAVDLGVNFFDSAPTYGDGRAERLLGRTIRNVGRDRLVIATKYGYDIDNSNVSAGSHREKRQDFSPAFIERDLEASLKRLGIDCIDLYQAHNLKLPQYTDDVAATMQKLVDKGRIRAWGVALGPAIGWREEGYRALLDHDADVVQTVFNLYEQDPGRELCELCQRRQRGGVIARVPTNSGILDEEFTSADHKFPAHDHRKFRDRNWLFYGLQKNEIIRPMAEHVGSSIRAFAFRWLLSHEHVVSIEPNLLSVEDVAAFAAAAEQGPLPAALMRELGELYDRDFDLGEAAHPCDLKSSVAPGGSLRSAYEPLDWPVAVEVKGT